MLFNLFLKIYFVYLALSFSVLSFFILGVIRFATLFFSGVLEHLSLRLCSGFVDSKSSVVTKANGGVVCRLLKDVVDS